MSLWTLEARCRGLHQFQRAAMVVSMLRLWGPLHRDSNFRCCAHLIETESRATRSATRKENKQLSTRQDRMVDMYFISPGFVHAFFKIFIVVGFTNRMLLVWKTSSGFSPESRGVRTGDQLWFVESTSSNARHAVYVSEPLNLWGLFWIWWSMKINMNWIS
jgi:hypothetical protein